MPICAPASADTIVEVQTVLGSLFLELNDEAAPQSVANFLNYVNADRYNGTFIHTVQAGALGFLNLSFTIYASEPQAIIQAQLESAVELDAPVPNMARFNAQSGELHLPDLAVDGSVLFRDVVFTLTDLDNALFTLTSFD